MSTIHSRILNVAQIAQRSARSSDDQQAAQALLDELSLVEVVVQVQQESPSPKEAAPIVPPMPSVIPNAQAQQTPVAPTPNANAQAQADAKPKGETKKAK